MNASPASAPVDHQVASTADAAGSRLARPLAGLLWGVIAAELVALVLLELIGGNDAFDVGAGGGPGTLTPLYAAVALTYGFFGAFIASRRSQNAVGWILWGAGGMIGLGLAGAGYAGLSLGAHGGSLPGTTLAAWVSAWAPAPALSTTILFLPLLYPTGHLLSSRWRPAAIAFAAMVTTTALSTILRPGPLDGIPSIANPTGVPALADATAAVLGALNVALFPAVSVAVTAAVVRYRRGNPVERLQLRWFGSALGLVAVVIVGAATLPGALADVSWTLVWVALGLIPIAIAFAILRYRLYEIDRIISRGIGWAVVTAVLATLFVVAIAGLQAVLAPFTSGSTLAVAASTLMAAALFQPLRQRVQRVVDRRFDRARYDAERTVAAFAERLRNDVDLLSIEDGILGTVHATVRPNRASVWLRQAPEPR